MVELRCPESCQYLVSARKETGHREGSFRIREFQAAGLLSPIPAEHITPALFAIEEAIVESQRERFHNLDDAEILAAIENAIRNIEIEESGLVYEDRDTSPRVQAISKSIRDAMDKLGERRQIDRRLTRADLIKALEYERDVVRAHLRHEGNAPGSRSFLRVIALFVPWPHETSAPLIIKGS